MCLIDNSFYDYDYDEAIRLEGIANRRRKPRTTEEERRLFRRFGFGEVKTPNAEDVQKVLMKESRESQTNDDEIRKNDK